MGNGSTKDTQQSRSARGDVSQRSSAEESLLHVMNRFIALASEFIGTPNTRPPQSARTELSQKPQGQVAQWIDKVVAFSSQYDVRSWPATCVIGPPKVYPKYGDIPGAWAQSVKDNKQFLELEVAESVYITGIDIYETYHCGGVTAVKALRSPNNWQTLWQSPQAFDGRKSRIFSPPLVGTDFKTRTIRIEVDCTASRSWVEIDAVKVYGDRTTQDDVTSQWVARVVSFSSQYDEESWPATCVIGSPKVYPRYGDISGAWAPGVIDNKQFLELEVQESVYITGIDIYETYHCGGVTSVKALRSPNNWQTLWHTAQPSNSQTSRIFSPPLTGTTFKTKTIRIEVDCTACGSWVEIDAVKVHGTRNLLTSCADGQLASQDGAIPNKPLSLEPIDCTTSQWVEKVVAFSSQYDSAKWPATCVIGPPKVYPKYGDIAGAWAPEVKDANQFLELEVAESVYIIGIDIYETYHCGGVTAVKALRSPNNWQTLWQSSQPIDSRVARVFSPPLFRTDFKTKTIRIEVNCTACRSWVEIDAIMLHGERNLSASQAIRQGAIQRNGQTPQSDVTSQWVERVISCSSQYDDYGWPARSVIGSPKVYPNYGDIEGAWAPGVIDNKQFLELEVKESVYISGIDIYETYHCGGVTAVKALRSPNNWQTLWHTAKPCIIQAPRKFSPPLKQIDWKTNRIRIDVDCTGCGSWVEIDAVQLHGYRSSTDTPSVNSNMVASSGAIGGATETIDLSQWVKKVTHFSSHYDHEGWHACNVTGVPKVYPAYGDLTGAWAPNEACLDVLQFLEVEFHEPVYVSGIEIYETFHAGGVVAVKGLDSNRAWQTLWMTNSPTNLESSRVFSPPLNTRALSCATKNIRIEVDCTAARDYVEIDAIRLHGHRYPSDDPPSYDSLDHNMAFPPVYPPMPSALMPSAPIVPASHNFIEPVINDKATSDCQFLLEGKHTVYAHKAVICAGEGNLKQVFNEDTKEPLSPDGKIMKELSDISHVGFMGLLQHIYYSQLPAGYKSVMTTGDWNGTPLNHYTSAMLIEVWIAEDKFKMEEMKAIIEVDIIGKVDEHNVIEMYKLASENSPAIETVVDYCKKYMKQNMEKIVSSPNFTSLPHDIMAYPY